MQKNVLLALALCLAGCLSAADYLPLASGNAWTYRDARTGATFEVRVSTSSLIKGHVYYSLKGFAPTPILARVNESGNIVTWDEKLGQDLLVTSFDAQRLSDFAAYGRQCPAWGRPQKDAVAYQGPAGSWSAAEVQFQPYTCADAGELLEQYVDNIGMVRRVVNTIAGPRTFDLVQAHVGKQVISAGETGRFGVAAILDAAGANWQVTMRVDTLPEPGPKVRFSSSQEFDLRLRDGNGNIVWTWSANRGFLQVLHTTDVGGWTATETVPVPTAITVVGFPRSYTLEAWLTVAEGEPRFAAATTLELNVPPRISTAGRRVRR